jgi:hypothetical protein
VVKGVLKLLGMLPAPLPAAPRQEEGGKQHPARDGSGVRRRVHVDARA